MFRKQLLELLRDRRMTVEEIARRMQTSPKEIVADLEHLNKSLKHSTDQLVVDPAVCRKCGFTFAETKFGKPSKCPECQSHWLRPPVIAVEKRP